MLDFLVTNARLVTEREVLRGSLGILDGRIQGLYLEGTPAPDAAEMLDAKDRSAAGPTAPPQGLFLMEYKFLDGIPGPLEDTNNC